MKVKTKAKNEMRLVIPSNSANESFARSTVAAFMAQLDPTIEEMTDIKTAVSEAVTNCIVHAYKDTIGNIWIEAKIYDDGRIKVQIKDRGCGIKDIAKAREPLFTTGGSERAGLGFAVMESFTDKLSVRSVVGKGTTVIMEKRVAQRYRHDS